MILIWEKSVRQLSYSYAEKPEAHNRAAGVHTYQQIKNVKGLFLASREAPQLSDLPL
jgi:hypothetical protein